jgi:hypothetical protein
MPVFLVIRLDNQELAIQFGTVGNERLKVTAHNGRLAPFAGLGGRSCREYQGGQR